MRLRVVFLLISAVFAAVPTFALAQLYLPGLASDLSISADPVAPGPNQSTTLTLQSSLADLENADITWTSNGKTIAEGVGETTIQVSAGDAGSTATIEAIVSIGDSVESASITLSPQTVDLLFDGASYVPPFYIGRSLPSPATSIRAEAVPHFVESGVSIPDSQLVYTWKKDGEVFGTLSGRGKSSAILPPPPLFGSSEISVEVKSADGRYDAIASAQVHTIDPSVTLYQDHPLFGIEYYNATPSRASVPDTEAAFAAIPYFISAPTPNDSTLTYRWRVNGSPVLSSSSTASELTLNASGASGPASISVSINSVRDYYLEAEGDWTISFGNTTTFNSTPSPSTQNALSSP